MIPRSRGRIRPLCYAAPWYRSPLSERRRGVDVRDARGRAANVRAAALWCRCSFWTSLLARRALCAASLARPASRRGARPLHVSSSCSSVRSCLRRQVIVLSFRVTAHMMGLKWIKTPPVLSITTPLSRRRWPHTDCPFLAPPVPSVVSSHRSSCLAPLVPSGALHRLSSIHGTCLWCRRYHTD